MKVFAIFAFIQIVGILGNPIAPEHDQAQNDVIEKVRELQLLIGSFSFGNLNEYPVEWTEQGKMKCRTNGGYNAENSGVEGVETFFDSYIELTDDTQLHLETASHAPHGSLASAVRTACNWFTRTDTLVTNLMHSLKPCWSTRESTSADLMYNISSALVEYVCENEGSHLLTFLTADDDVCLSSSEYGLKSCYDTSFSYDTSVFETAVYSRLPNTPWEVPIIGLNTQACREFGTFQQCIVRVLGRCQNLTLSSEINSLFNIVKNTSGCKNLLEA